MDPDPVAGNMNLSAIEDGGDIGRDVRMGRLPRGEVPDSALCCGPLLARVGVNSGPSSRDRKRDESNDSSSSRWKLGVDRYRVVSDRVPIGWGTDGNTCVSVGKGWAVCDGCSSVCQRAW